MNSVWEKSPQAYRHCCFHIQSPRTKPLPNSLLKLLPELEKIEGHRQETEKRIHLPSISGHNSEDTSSQNTNIQPKFNTATGCDLNKITNDPNSMTNLNFRER